MVGSISIYAGSGVPNGYLVCDGSAVSRSEYSALFDVIGVTYGVGDGETTFNLPDLSSRVGMGFSANYMEGNSGGEALHVLDVSETPTHSHIIPSHGHANTISIKTPQLAHTITTQPSFTYVYPSGSAPRYLQVNKDCYNTRSNASMSRATSVAITAHPATACTMSGGVTDCPAFDTEPTGSGDAHNNMMPYIALVYLIQAEPDTPPGPVIPSMVLFNGALPVGPSGAYIAGRR